MRKIVILLTFLLACDGRALDSDAGSISDSNIPSDVGPTPDSTFRYRPGQRIRTLILDGTVELFPCCPVDEHTDRLIDLGPPCSVKVILDGTFSFEVCPNLSN